MARIRCRWCMSRVDAIRGAVIGVGGPLLGFGLTGLVFVTGQQAAWQAPFFLILIFGPRIAGGPALGRALRKLGEQLEGDS